MSLYKPFKSTAKGKKFSVYVKDGNKKKLIHFGAKGYGDFRSGTATRDQRDRFLKRAKKIKTKQGTPAYLDKNRASHWAVKYLWLG